MMLLRIRLISALGVALSLALVIAACGSARSSDSIARIGSVKITKTALNHWMATLAAGDYTELSGGHTIPAGLVSEPPTYTACVTRLEAAQAASPIKPSHAPTRGQLLTKCQQLYHDLRKQTAAYLVNAQWLASIAKEQGITVTDKEVLQYFQQSKITHPLLATEARVHEYLDTRRLSLSDYLFILKLDLIQQKLQQRFGQEPNRQAALTEAEQRWTNNTSCDPGYIVQHCKQYTGAPEYGNAPPPSVLIEQVVTLATGRCINRPACAQQ